MAIAVTGASTRVQSASLAAQAAWGCRNLESSSCVDHEVEDGGGRGSSGGMVSSDPQDDSSSSMSDGPPRSTGMELMEPHDDSSSLVVSCWRRSGMESMEPHDDSLLSHGGSALLGRMAARLAAAQATPVREGRPIPTVRAAFACWTAGGPVEFGGVLALAWFAC
jgi:hypothetical protein